jgi:dephospho-CoA kinase
MFELTIGLIGRISVGKSSIARALNASSDIPVTSFGAYLTKFSGSRNLPVDRKSLQDLGQKFIEEDHRQFLENVIEDVSATGRVIIEGIRHSVILNDIKSVSTKSLLIYIDASVETRYNRYTARQKDNDSPLSFMEFVRKDNHIVESEIEPLKRSCDLIVNSEELGIDLITDKILSFL